LAGAIAFGFGARGVARDVVEEVYERRDEATSEDSGTQSPSLRRET
jgi:hypothetical protein